MCYNKFGALNLIVIFLFFAIACQQVDDLPDSAFVADAQLEAASGRSGGGPGGNPSQHRLSSEVLMDWNNVFLELDQFSRGMRPNATARALAYIYLASYETAAPTFRAPSLSRRHQELTIDRDDLPRDIDVSLALNRSFALTLDHFLLNLPADKRSLIAQFEDSKEAQLSAGMSDDVIAASKDWGALVAQEVILFSQTDVAAESQILEPQPRSYEPPTGPGYWTYSADPERALFPYWGSVRTFVISAEETSSEAPPEFNTDSGSEYYQEMVEVMEISNAAKAEDGENLWIAEFWSDDVEGLMISPPGRQVSIANQLIDQADLGLEQSIKLMLKLGFSLNDAAVSTWADKYKYMVMRPNVYIHAHLDAAFETNLYRLIYWPNPSFPSYPSGHSCFASAAAGVLIDQFGDNIQFTDRTHADATEFRGAPRSYSSLREMAKENALSRLPLGVHMRMDCEEGLRLGYEISRAVNRLNLSRNGRAVASSE